MKNFYTLLFVSLLAFSTSDVLAQTAPCSLVGAVVTVPYSAPPIMMHAAVNGMSQYTYGWNDGTPVGSSSQKPFYSGWCVTITDLMTGCDTTICESCIPNGGVGPCTMISIPVCGCDGMPYGNPCMAMQQGIFTYTSAIDSLTGQIIPCTTPIPSWDCVNGACIDPNSGNGQYLSATACLIACMPPVPSWDCVNGACIDPMTGNGQYPTLSDCVLDSCIVIPPVPSWDCFNGACIDPLTGNGQYPTFSDCILDSCIVIPPVPSWDCINGSCIDPQTGFGQYPTLNDCVFDSCAVMPPVSSWDCVGNACVDPGTGAGMYASQAACNNVCLVSGVEEQTTNKKLLKITDLLGRETKDSKNDVLFYIYDDGSVEKRIVIE